ncbi:MAG: hypothetical protein ACK58U_11525 [Rubrivivax sp.]|jgi:hypothetical protein
MPTYAAPGFPEKKLESRNAQKVARLLAAKLKPLGFQRTKTSFYTRPRPLVIQFVHLHKFTFESSFRLHFGVRVRTDTFPAAHLNGPNSDEIRDPENPTLERYRFWFDPEPESLEACAEEIVQCVLAEGEDWFRSVESAEHLLSTASPLTQQARLALKREVEGSVSREASNATQQALNAALYLPKQEQ